MAFGGRQKRRFAADKVPVRRSFKDRTIDRRLNQHAITRLEHRMQRHVETGNDARKEDDLVGRNRPAVFFLHVGNDPGAQLVAGDAVAEHRMLEPVADGIDDLRCCGEVHVGDPHGQHVVRILAPLRAAGAPAFVHRIEIGHALKSPVVILPVKPIGHPHFGAGREPGKREISSRCPQPAARLSTPFFA
jgi:hypothetical protein